MTTTTFTVVVAAHSADRFDQTCRCVTSAGTGRRAPEELLVVVDNNSPLEERLRTALAGQATVLSNDGDGAADARTTALRHAKGEVLVFVDDDAWVEDDFLEILEDAFSDRELVAAGARIVPDWADPRLALPPELYWVVGSTYRGHREDAGPITRPIGAAMAIRRDALEAVGGFHPAFGPRKGKKTSSNEELATFTLVTRRHGEGSVHYLPGAVAHHFAPAARCGLDYVLRRSYVEGTSKADARILFGSEVMGHDRNYVRSVLLRALAQHASRAVGAGDRQAARAAVLDVASLAAAGAGYGVRLAGNRLARPARHPAA